MVVVLFAVSVIVFLIFNVIPNSDPAARIAGEKSAGDAQLIANINEEWGFDEPLPVQYLTMMKLVFTGELVSYENPDRRRSKKSSTGIPATLSLCVGAAVIWMSFALLFGYLSAVRAGGWTDRLLTILALVGISMPVFWLAGISPHLPDLQGRALPGRRIRRPDRRPGRMGLPPDPALAHPGDPLHRLLQPGAALEHARHDERGLRAHGAGQGAARAPGAGPARAAQLADPDRHPLRARLRRRGRRRRDPHRSPLRPPRGRPVRGRSGRKTSTCRR